MSYTNGFDKKGYMKRPIQNPEYEIDGVYRGIVEDDKDPLQMGRVKVRIPILDGVPIDPEHPFDNGELGGFIATGDLAWCPVIQMGAGFQQGSFLTPEVGTTVIVGFEDKNRTKPLVLGTIFSASSDKPKILGNFNPTVDAIGASNEDYIPNYDNSEATMVKSGGKYFSHANKKEIPIEAQNSPKNKVIYKSPKGAIIYIVEQDGYEELTIRDRGGQKFRMCSPITEEYNEYNNARFSEDLNNTDAGTPLSAPATIEMVNRNDEGILLTTDKDGNSTLMLSADKIITRSPIQVYSEIDTEEEGVDNG